METTIKINTDAISNEFIQKIKNLFPHKTVEITIRPSDETEYMLAIQYLQKSWKRELPIMKLKKSHNTKG